MGVDPFRKIAALAHRKVNERVAAPTDAADQRALDNQVVKIAQPARGRLARCRDSVVIHVVVAGHLLGNVFSGCQHLPRDRVVNGVPVGVGHVISVAVVLLAAAILRRLVGAHAQRHPAKPRIGRAGIVRALNDGAVFNGLVFGRQHHAAISCRIRAKDDIAHVRSGVIRIRGIERHGFVRVFASASTASTATPFICAPFICAFTGRQLTLNHVLARVQVAVLFFVKAHAQCERLELNDLIRLGDVDAVRVNARHFRLTVGVLYQRGEKVNGVGLRGLPFERARPGDFGLGPGHVAARFAAHRRVGRRENHAVGVVFVCARLQLRHERGAALEYALILPGGLEFFVFNADRACGGPAHNGARFQFIDRLNQERQAELAHWRFCGWRHKMQRAHVLAGNVVNVKRGKQVDEPAVLVVQDVLAVQQRVEQFFIVGLGAGELKAHVGVNEVNASRRTNVKQLARAVRLVRDRVVGPHVGHGAIFIHGHNVLHLKRVRRRPSEMLG